MYKIIIALVFSSISFTTYAQDIKKQKIDQNKKEQIKETNINNENVQVKEKSREELKKTYDTFKNSQVIGNEVINKNEIINVEENKPKSLESQVHQSKPNSLGAQMKMK